MATTAICHHSSLPWEGSPIPSSVRSIDPSPSTPGPPALEACPAYSCALTSLTRQFTHRNNIIFCLLGEMNSWNQNCIKVCVAEYLQRNLTKFFQKNTGQSIAGASYYQRNTELLGSYAGTLRINVQYP